MAVEQAIDTAVNPAQKASEFNIIAERVPWFQVQAVLIQASMVRLSGDVSDIDVMALAH